MEFSEQWNSRFVHCTSKLKTFATEPVISSVEYAKLEKNNYFLHQELHHKKLFHYFGKLAQIYETGLVFLMKKNATLAVTFFQKLDMDIKHMHHFHVKT